MKRENKISPKPANSVLQTNKNSSSPFFRPIVQPKLTINQPNDIFEQEADAIADKVMRMPDKTLGSLFFQASPLSISPIQRKCAECEEEEKVQMKGEAIAGGGMTAPSSVNKAINSGGQPLPPKYKEFYGA
jgi:hypothetical protein